MFQKLAEKVHETNSQEKTVSKRGGPRLTVENDRKELKKEEKSCC
jgi:hypothetical protein